MKVRTVIAYKHYFIDFVKSLPEKLQDKITKTILYVETLQMIPEKYLKHIEGAKGLYEIWVRFSSEIVRVFCFFDGGKRASKRQTDKILQKYHFCLKTSFEHYRSHYRHLESSR